MIQCRISGLAWDFEIDCIDKLMLTLGTFNSIIPPRKRTNCGQVEPEATHVGFLLILRDESSNPSLPWPSRCPGHFSLLGYFLVFSLGAAMKL